MKSAICGRFALAALLVLGGAGCGVPSATPPPTIRPAVTPTASPSPTQTVAPAPSPPPSAATTVTSAAQAAALVFASDERWSHMSPLRSDMIGQSTWYEATQVGNEFRVEITVGQGDCFAGCIERHTWSYAVTAAGEVRLADEEGDEVQVEEPAGGDGPARLTVQLTSGPTCPVEQIPPDPNCAGRPVQGAEVVIKDPTGSEVARESSDENGMASIDLPAGAYYVEAEAVQAMMGTPEAQAFAFVGGGMTELLFAYDTGIR